MAEDVQPNRATNEGWKSAGYRHRGGVNASADWQEHLLDYVTRNGMTGGELNWSRLHRRSLYYGTVLPRRKSTFERLAFLIDVSGSINVEKLETATAQVAQAIDMLQPLCGCVVIYFNHNRTHVVEVMTGQELVELELPFRGGWEIPHIALDYLTENGLTCDAIVVFTDGYLTDNELYEWQRLAEVDALVVCSETVPTAARKAGANAIYAGYDRAR